MSTKITGKYLGNKKHDVRHESGVVLRTDAPKDIQGEGTSFSPTDLVGVALGSCMLTTVAIVADRDQIPLTGSHFSVEKEMGDKPRRIAKLTLALHFPSSLTPEQREKVQRTAQKCPVHHSLHPETVVDVSFVYNVSV